MGRAKAMATFEQLRTLAHMQQRGETKREMAEAIGGVGMSTLYRWLREVDRIRADGGTAAAVGHYYLRHMESAQSPETLAHQLTEDDWLFRVAPAAWELHNERILEPEEFEDGDQRISEEAHALRVVMEELIPDLYEPDACAVPFCTCHAEEAS